MRVSFSPLHLRDSPAGVADTHLDELVETSANPRNTLEIFVVESVLAENVEPRLVGQLERGRVVHLQRERADAAQ